MKYSRARLLIWRVAPVITLLASGALSVEATDATIQRDTLTQLSSPTAASREDSLFVVINAGYQSVKPILRKSCFDCHSRFTVYPWYHSLPLVKSFIDDDVKKAQKYLDLSDDFPFKGKAPVDALLDAIKSEIEDGDMPPWDYRLMHWGRLVEGPEQDSMFRWVDSSLALLKKQP